jgi:hypothetical protein
MKFSVKNPVQAGWGFLICSMSKKYVQGVFVLCLVLTVFLLLSIYGLEFAFLLNNESNMFVAETTLYLSGLGTLYFGWRLIEHKLPSKKK